MLARARVRIHAPGVARVLCHRAGVRRGVDDAAVGLELDGELRRGLRGVPRHAVAPEHEAVALVCVCVCVCVCVSARPKANAHECGHAHTRARARTLGRSRLATRILPSSGRVGCWTARNALSPLCVCLRVRARVCMCVYACVCVCDCFVCLCARRGYTRGEDAGRGRGVRGRT